MEMEEYERKLRDLLDAEHWRGRTCGKIDGVLAVLELLKIPMENRAEILADVVGLSMATANDFLEDYKKKL